MVNKIKVTSHTRHHPLLLVTVLTACSAFTTGGSCWPGNNARTTHSPSSKLHVTHETSPASTSSSSSSASERIKTCDVLSLDSIRETLIRQEETIIFGLIERAQFRRNDVVYEKGGFGDLGFPRGYNGDTSNRTRLSLFEYMFIGTEILHSECRRYTSPQEHAFFPEHIPTSPNRGLPQLDFPELLSSVGGASSVNYNSILLRRYLSDIVPSITSVGDDEQHGSTSLSDINVLQAISHRVHYGKFVAESKYRSDPEGYQRLVDAGDAEGVMALLTNAAVEEKVLRRARLKAATYGREPLIANLPELEGEKDVTSIVAAAAASAVTAAIEAMGKYGCDKMKVNPSIIEDIYRDIIIPLTKDIEVAYLFRRCGREPPEEYDQNKMGDDRLKMKHCML